MTVKRLLKITLCLALIGVALAAIAGWLAYRAIDRSPGDLLRYTERRLMGHPKLEFVALPAIHRLRAVIERPIAADFTLPMLGKGIQMQSLPPQQYDAAGRPVPSSLSNSQSPAETSTFSVSLVRVASGDELQRAIIEAVPGTTIEILPGVYPRLRDFKTQRSGTSTSPIRVMARKPGTAKLEFEGGEGFRVAHSYWQFENLDMRGTCKEHAWCEHAFHIYDAARGVVVRNNRISDFNAQIKVNGVDGRWPDYGLVQYNTMVNSEPRRTGLPTTPFDLVGAHGWVVADNVVANFVKLEGNQVSYGLFMKGGSREGRIERNLLVCSLRDISSPGVRIGISMGGGTTDKGYCRDKQCPTEHSGGVVANNIIAHCNDAGIDVNRSNQILVSHNVLINTAGISLRDPISSADLLANLLEGGVHVRDGALMNGRDNTIGALRGLFEAPDHLDLRWQSTPATVSIEPKVSDDFCQRKRGATTLSGAFDNSQPCASATPQASRI
jgi:hypothetical protein